MSILDYYKELLDVEHVDFIKKYLEVPSLKRIKEVGYFCGMDYASKEIYDFKEYVTRFDHSLTTALLTYKITKNKTYSLAALFHDVGSPCFSHVIDYMNKDYKNQESTEEYNEKIIRNDKKLKKLLKEDNIDIEDIIDFKKYTIVDNKRPKLCADRLDGIILTGAFWTKEIDKDLIKEILDSIEIYTNEDMEDEIGFNNKEIYDKIMIINENIDIFCHSKENNYMMELLASITKEAIDEGIIEYDDLYSIGEREILELISLKGSTSLSNKMNKFYHVTLDEIEELDLPYIKKRTVNPLVNGKRIKLEE